MTKEFISLGLLGGLVRREGMHNRIAPLETAQKPLLDSPAICSVVFI